MNQSSIRLAPTYWTCLSWPLLGGPIATRLLECGQQLTVFDRNEKQLVAIAEGERISRIVRPRLLYLYPSRSAYTSLPKYIENVEATGSIMTNVSVLRGKPHRSRGKSDLLRFAIELGYWSKAPNGVMNTSGLRIFNSCNARES
jgi:hypothetical protein